MFFRLIEEPQFYTSCAQIKVSGGGSASPATVSIPGAFKDTDPGYTANIYNGLTSYTVPGPSVFTCSGGGGGGGGGGSNPQQPAPAPTTTLRTTTVSNPGPTNNPGNGGGSGGCSVAKYGQCGGTGYSGCAACASGSTCSATNEYCKSLLFLQVAS